MDIPAPRICPPLIIEPNRELKFPGPYDRDVEKEIQIKNPTDRIVLFHIQSTAPKYYNVKSNFGAILPFGILKLKVRLYSFEYNPKKIYGHIFVIQSIFVPRKRTDLNALWRSINQRERLNTHIFVKFDQPKPNNPVNVVDHENDSAFNGIDEEEGEVEGNEVESNEAEEELEEELEDDFETLEIIPTIDNYDMSSESDNLEADLMRMDMLIVERENRRLTRENRELERLNTEYSSNLKIEGEQRNNNVGLITIVYAVLAVIIFCINYFRD